MSKIVIYGIDFDAKAIEDNRETVIQVRDAALKQGAMDWAFSLSMTIALLADLKRRVEGEDSK